MRPTPLSRPRLAALAILVFGSLVSTASHAQTTGFAINRYEPSSAGSWMFGVETPWYSQTRWFAGGLTLNYAYNPLVLGTVDAQGKFVEQSAVVAHSVITHIDLAGSFLDRVQLSLSLPVTFAEVGTRADALAFGPIGSPGVGDMRIGAMVRAWKQADKDPISIHVGAYLWVPFMQNDTHQGDGNVRFMPRVILAGLVRDHIRYAVNVGFLIRPEARLSPLIDGATAGSEFQVGLGAGYTDKKQTYYVGPEIQFASQMVPGRAFTLDTSSLEVLIGGNYLIKDLVMVGAALGPGFMTAAGSPDMRLLVRAAYAPVKDTDGDGIKDRDDACPKVKGVASNDPRTHGCPEPDRDRDKDGVLDIDDVCPDEPQGSTPDPKRRGCPAIDTDLDGVFDFEDACLTIPQGKVPDPAEGRKGCPKDTDGDTVIDEDDLCPEVHMGLNPDPDPARLGCPIGDRDKDQVPDNTDACPDKPGAPDPDPAKNGCPGLVQIKDGKIVILAPVFFATNKDVILPKSFPVMNAVANALKASAQIKKIRVEGHTDNRGSLPLNISLSDRRAKSCVRYLLQQGIDASRLEGQGYGPTRPIDDNRTDKGRAANRRVDFVIIDPPPPGGAAAPPVPKMPAGKAAGAKGPAAVKGKKGKKR